MIKKSELFAGYVPVIHDGYIKALNRHPNARIGIFNNEILDDIPYLRKDIRAINPTDAVKAISGLGRDAFIMGRSDLQTALKKSIIMPEDDITRKIIDANPNANITTEPIFLRWDRDNSNEQSLIKPDRINHINKNSQIAKKINHNLSLSTNWWRHVAAIIHDGNGIIYLDSFNTSLPTEYTSIIEGDPRITSKKGESIECSIDIHAEARVIAEASKRGIALKGLAITVSTFPCPNCAKLIALSGIKTCYYIDGYALIDGFSILKNFEVEIVKLEMALDKKDPRTLKPYPPSQS